jgi:hypothetical protein
MDHALLFSETVYYYFPKRGILIFRNGVRLFTETGVLLITDYTEAAVVDYEKLEVYYHSS